MRKEIPALGIAVLVCYQQATADHKLRMPLGAIPASVTATSSAATSYGVMFNTTIGGYRNTTPIDLFLRMPRII